MVKNIFCQSFQKVKLLLQIRYTQSEIFPTLIYHFNDYGLETENLKFNASENLNIAKDHQRRMFQHKYQACSFLWTQHSVGVSHLPLDSNPKILYGVHVRGEHWPINSFWYLWQCGQREASSTLECLGWGLHWLDLRSEWTNTSRWHGSPHRHWLWKLHTGIQAPWTLGPWFPNEMQHLLSSEKLVLVHSDAVIHAEWGKEFRIKYKVHRNEHTSQRPDTDTENILFLIGLCHVLMFSDTSFYFFIMCKP